MKRAFKRTSWRPSCMCLAAMSMAGLISPQLIRGQTKVASTTLTAQSGRGLEPFGVWSGNSFLDVEGHASAAPVIHVYDGSGSERQRIVVQVPESVWIILTNGGFTRSEDGWVAVAGVAHGLDNKAANFLAVISPDAQRQVLVRTDSYISYAVVFSPDGTVWTAGHSLGIADYPIIRRFDKTGKLLGSVLPRSRFSASSNPFRDSYLVVSKDRVGWFSAGGGPYIEFSPDGGEIASYKHALTPIDGFPHADGVALCEDNSVWVSGELPDKAGNVQSVWYVLDREHDKWQGGQAVPASFIYGCRGTTLAVSSGANIDWIKPR
jgi:hypothetical protein